MPTIPEQIAAVGRELFDRRLTDFSGGNISVRGEGQVYITPRFAGGQKHWNLAPADILYGPLDTDDLLNNPLFSREGKAHLAIYRNFPDAGAVIHAHPFHVLPFCAAGKPIPPVLEGTQKFGVIECIAEAPAHSADLAENIVAGLKGKDERIRKHAAAVILPRHGLIVAGKDLFLAIDAVERIDWNAYCILSQKLLP
ncbi:MAG: class II aldolase/adducin family protein [Anaerolineaceae bacterium]|nr:class II aldolase/adducin family protein [Anaerolineaceae bacterium]